MSDLSGIVSSSSAMSMIQTKAQADVSVLRKALDIQKDNAARMIESLPDFNPVSPAGELARPGEAVGSLVNERA